MSAANQNHRKKQNQAPLVSPTTHKHAINLTCVLFRLHGVQKWVICTAYCFGDLVSFRSFRRLIASFRCATHADLQTDRLYVVLPLPSLIANLTNPTEVLVWLTGVLVWLIEVLVWLTEVRVCKSVVCRTPVSFWSFRLIIVRFDSFRDDWPAAIWSPVFLLSRTLHSPAFQRKLKFVSNLGKNHQPPTP